jgi:hypothetical protein
MIKIENLCNHCTLPCIDCGLKRVPVYYCDKCKDEISEDVYEVDGAELCEECLKKLFKKEI